MTNRRGFLGTLVGLVGLATVGAIKPAKPNPNVIYLPPGAKVTPLTFAPEEMDYAITANELLALRGRKPYSQGGHDPMKNG